MTIAAGTKLGRYEIRSKIGEGGMGEVYRATDLTLNRDVAIKVLPGTFLNDAERLARFQREAQVLASLNHTNIATIYGVEEENGFRALVMELVEGPTLADRIALGPIPLDDGLAIARQIAEALEAAHERGIIHRDLKPANVKVTPEGTVKVLDFGLAKVFEVEAQVTDLSHSPTLVKGTQAGVILGTAAYMSPEQAKGKVVDRRADIWAFGCVLFEMLSGNQTFSGETLTDTLAAVVRAEPEWETLPQSTPDSIRRLLHRCLTKDPKLRLRDIGEARIAVSEPQVQQASIASAAPAQSQSTWRRLLPWTTVVLLAAGLLAISLMYLSRTPKTQPLLRSSINLPGFTLDIENSSLALSPDGKRLVFAATGSDGTSQQLWIRSMDSMTTQSLPGTNGATYPFWSPDGRFVGFFADKKLKRMEISTGTVQNLCDAIEGRGATWSHRDVIVFASAAFGPLSEVSAAGGTPVQLTSVERNDLTHRNPHFLPDGKRLLFFRGSSSSRSEKTDGIYSLDLETKKVEQIANEKSEGIYVEPGYLVFVRDGNLMAQPIDADRLRTSGQAVSIAEKVSFNPLRLTGGYSLSATGLLVFDGGSRIVKSQLTWFDIEGKSLGTVSGPASFISISISPDGKRAEALVLGFDNTHSQLWMYDLNRGIASRFTGGSEDFYPGTWSPDGRLVAYTMGGGSSFLYLQPSDSSSEPQKISTTQSSLIPASWSPDGEMIVFNSQTSLGVDLWIQPLNGDRQAYPFLATPANEIEGAISPDGHWIAFISDESGRYELYVTSFPSPGVKRQISSDGADAPQWLNGGSKLAYINAERKLILVNVNVKGQEFVLGESHIVFGGKPLRSLPHPLGGWDVPVYISSDPKRILLPAPVESNASPSLTLVANWTATLQR
ncbi:MAG: protein kinase domain-containing protein [Pyrinomonadaceae bacterium]